MIQNMRIESAFLGWEDHGILTLSLTLKGEGMSQVFGGFALDQPLVINNKTDGRRRVGTAFGTNFIMRVMHIAGVSYWSALTGKYVRIDGDYEQINRIGHITKDEWFDPKDLAEKPNYK